jgi:tryptophan synthase alpha chain
MNRITKLFENKKDAVLNIFYTAGYPRLNDTITILKYIEQAGVDMVEIGMPYSDPMADGPIIQESNTVALNNGMSIAKLFEQLEGIRNTSTIPILLMGYLNPVLQYGITRFVEKAAALGIDGVIIPDLPLKEYEINYKALFEKHKLSVIFLVSPQTSAERIKKIDSLSNGFIYVISTNSTTGNREKEADDNKLYLSRIKSIPFKNPKLVGFNIKDNSSFVNACNYAQGAIIGSAFIKLLNKSLNIEDDIFSFVKKIRNN